MKKRFMISMSFLFLFTISVLAMDQNTKHTGASTESKNTQVELVNKNNVVNVPVKKEESVVKEKKDNVFIKETHIVVPKGLNVRSLPTPVSKILFTLEHNQIIYIKAKLDNGWLELKTGGFVNGKYTIKIASDFVGDKTVARSAQHKTASIGVNVPSNLTVQEAEYLLRNTNLKGHGIGRAAVLAERKDGTNAFFTIAVAKLESGNGKSKLSRDRNNLFGIKAYDGRVRKHASRFEKKADSVYEFSRLIQDRYLGQGLRSLKSINRVYCPTDNTWSTQVLSIMKSDLKSLKYNK